MQRLLTALLVCLGAVATASAQADTPVPKQVKYKFEKQDLDQSGDLTFEEWRSDMPWFKENLPKTQYQAHVARLRAKFDLADTDQSGTIAFDEALAYDTSEHISDFNLMDSNGDGRLTIDEYLAAPERLHAGKALLWAFSETYEKYPEKSSIEIARIAQQKVSDWGQKQDRSDILVITPPIAARLGRDFADLDLNSSTSVSLDEYTNVKLGYYYKFEDARAREAAHDQQND